MVTKKLIFGKGIDKRVDLIDTAILYGIITMSGAGFYKVPGVEGTIRGTDALYNSPADVMRAVQEAVRQYQEEHKGMSDE